MYNGFLEYLKLKTITKFINIKISKQIQLKNT